MNGFITLPRSWLDSRITGNPDFLAAVAYLAKEINEKGVVEFSSGDAKLRFGMSPRRYRTFMSLITGDKLTDKQATNRTTNIAFDCQIVTSTKRQARRQTGDKPNDKQTHKKFIPPTEPEVKAYVLEMGYHFNPEAFVPHYQSKGWKVGNEPMKDWRAACRTWETSWKQKYGEQFYYQINETRQPTSCDNHASRKAQRDRGLSLAAKIVSQSENLLNLYNGEEKDPDTR